MCEQETINCHIKRWTGMGNWWKNLFGSSVTIPQK